MFLEKDCDCTNHLNFPHWLYENLTEREFNVRLLEAGDTRKYLKNERVRLNNFLDRMDRDDIGSIDNPDYIEWAASILARVEKVLRKSYDKKD